MTPQSPHPVAFNNLRQVHAVSTFAVGFEELVRHCNIKIERINITSFHLSFEIAAVDVASKTTLVHMLLIMITVIAQIDVNWNHF